LRLFQHTLIGPSTKWYVEEQTGNGIELLSEFKQTSTTHIDDHIHKWRRRHILCKDEATKKQFLNWFLKSLVSLLAKDVAATFPQYEEEAIDKDQQFKLIYSQLGYLYMVLPNAPRPMPFIQDKPEMSHSTDGLIGTTTHHNPYPPQPTMYVTPPYPLVYGGNPCYPPPPYKKPYPIALPPPISGPSSAPMMSLTFQPTSRNTSPFVYTLSTSESVMPSYVPYRSLPQHNLYFPFPGPPQPIASP
jgi:hypothetical protein